MSHAQDIERIIQQNWGEVAPIPSDRALACQLQTVRAALASVERDRARLERALALKDDAITLLRDSLTEAEAPWAEIMRWHLGQKKGNGE